MLTPFEIDAGAWKEALLKASALIDEFAANFPSPADDTPEGEAT